MAICVLGVCLTSLALAQTGTGATSTPVQVVVGVTGGGVSPISPTIVVQPAALVGETITARASLSSGTALPALSSGTPTTYQWIISGGRITSDPKAASVDFVADKSGTVFLLVTIAYNGNSYAPFSEVKILAPDVAGEITTAPTAVVNATNLTASVPPAQNGDRTFRWTGSGGIVITGATDAPTVTFRASSVGPAELVCNVSLLNLLTIQLHTFVVVTGSGAPVQLTVNGGSGGGAWPGGSRTDIFADPPPAGQVFDRWTGDTKTLGTDPLAPLTPHTVVTVPDSAIALTATYKPAPAWMPVNVTNFNPQSVTNLNGQTSIISTTLTYYIPTSAQGLVFLLHDTNGSTSDWFSRPEQILLTRDLVAAGYGIAALNAHDRGLGTWAGQAALANNLDALNHAAALNKFAADGTFAATKPVFFLGTADSGEAAASYAEMLATAKPARSIRGVVLYCAAGTEARAVTTQIPQLFALATRDTDLGIGGLATARNNAQLLAGRGIATTVVTNGVSPVYPNRFLPLGVSPPAFAATDAQTVHAALKTANLLDANGYLKALPSTDALRAALPAVYQSRTADIAAQLAISTGEQQLFSEASARVIDFFNHRIAGTPAAPPARLVNLSTRTSIASATATFALGFNLTGPDKATLLIRGIGPALTAFGLATAISAPHLDVNDSKGVIASNEGWDKSGATAAAQISSAAASIGAFPLSPGSNDTALLLQLSPGTYTVNLRGINGVTGDVLAEVYDVSKNNTRFTNLSTLASINSAGELLIPGVVVAPAAPGSTTPRTLMIRAIGPGLATFGIPASDVLGDPTITLFNGRAQIATNGNWYSGGNASTAALVVAFPSVGAFPLRFGDSDAALLVALPPAAYTVQTKASPFIPIPGSSQTTAPNAIGKVLVEVYEVP